MYSLRQTVEFRDWLDGLGDKRAQVRIVARLIDKLAAQPALVERTELLLRTRSHIVPRPEAHLSLGLRDPDDEWIVASAVTGQADILVTGDADLLDVHERTPIHTVSPRQSWRILRENGPQGPNWSLLPRWQPEEYLSEEKE